MENLGKKKCEVLKEVRKKIADANGIEYTPRQCDHKGECSGTCPACEQEARFIENSLSRLRKAGKAAVIVGTALGISALGSSCSRVFNPPHPVGIVPCEVDSVVEMELEGDVVAPAVVEVDSTQVDSAGNIAPAEQDKQ